jgi:hypothetical protein
MKECWLAGWSSFVETYLGRYSVRLVSFRVVAHDHVAPLRQSLLTRVDIGTVIVPIVIASP